MIEELISCTLSGQAAVAFVCLSFLYFWIRKWQVSQEIRSLGMRAPEIPSNLPLAIDFIYKYMKASAERRDMEFWSNTLKEAGARIGSESAPFTAELNSGISMREIFTIDPENIKAILSAQFADYGKGKRFHDEWKEFIGDSVFGTDGERWSYARQILRPMFETKRMVDTEIFESHVQKLITLLEVGDATAKGDQSVDIVPLFLRYTLDAATEYLLGEGTDSLGDPQTRVAEAFRYVLERQSDFFRMDDFSFLLSRKKFRQELKIMDDFVYPYVQKALSLSSSELSDKISKKDTLLHSLAQATEDPKFIRDQLITILLAGRDTTAGTLSFIFFELSRHPEILSLLRSEIALRLGTGSSSQKPTFTDLKEMKVLNAVLNETLRFYPVVPLNIRYSLRNTTLPRGGGPDGSQPIGVAAGTRVLYSAMLLQKLPDLYPGPKDGDKYFDPGKWLPKRWLSGWHPRTWEFIPFHRGQRACIGQGFSMVEMGYTVVRILQAFENVLMVGDGVGKGMDWEPKVRVEVTMSPDEEIRCLFVKGREVKECTLHSRFHS